MRAKHVMTDCVVALPVEASVYDAAEMLVGAGVSAAPVVDGSGRLVGILSEADLIHRVEIDTVERKSWLLRLLADDITTARTYIRSNSRRVADVMTRKVITASEEATLGELAALMHENTIKRIPILRDGALVGIVSRANLVQALLSQEPDLEGAGSADDEKLLRAVDAALDDQSWTSAWPTNVVVHGGVVHLWGFVAGESVREAYRVAAENVPGVRKVVNHMRPVPAGVHMGV
jgi:CBS domain-containing protein